MMAFKNLSSVIVLKRGCSGPSNIEKEIYTDREIGGINESSVVLLDQCSDAVEFFVPAGGADHHVLARFHAGFDVGQDAMRGREIDHAIKVGKSFGRESCSCRV